MRSVFVRRFVRRSLMLRRWLAHVRCGLAGPLRGTSCLSVRLLRSGMPHVVRHIWILGPWRRRIVRTWSAFLCRRTGNIVLARFGLVYVRLRLRLRTSRFRSSRCRCVVRRPLVIRTRSRGVVGMSFVGPLWRMRNCIVRMGDIGCRIRVRRGCIVGSALRRMWNVIVGRARLAGIGAAGSRGIFSACIVRRRSLYRWIVRHRCITGSSYAGAAEGRRLRRCRYFGPAMIDGTPIATDQRAPFPHAASVRKWQRHGARAQRLPGPPLAAHGCHRCRRHS